MIVVIDNYDSFTYNLVQLLGRLTEEIEVFRNDRATVQSIRDMHPSGILISPGPGRPENAGISVQVIRELGSTIPILGVCLGHQAIGYAFGGSIVHAPNLMHGKTSSITHRSTPLFKGISNPFEATRYHSLVISQDGFPEELELTAVAADNTIMGVRHRQYPIEGVQFHPESILTKDGFRLVTNWLEVQQCK
jgi:anthranilate synthase/aminodeoxychorismate synthase-like glutamine amidotransferase